MTRDKTSKCNIGQGLHKKEQRQDWDIYIHQCTNKGILMYHSMFVSESCLCSFLCDPFKFPYLLVLYTSVINNNALCSCFMLLRVYYAQNYAGIILQNLRTSVVFRYSSCGWVNVRGKFSTKIPRTDKKDSYFNTKCQLHSFDVYSGTSLI